MLLYYTGLVVIPLLLVLSVIGFMNRAKYDTTHTVVFYMIVYALFNEILLRVSIIVFKSYSIILYNLITLGEFVLIFTFFCTFLNFKKYRASLLLMSLLFLGVYIYQYFSKGLFVYHSYSYLTKNALILILCAAGIRKMISEPKEKLITEYSLFWIIGSILLYHGCTTLLFGMRKYTVNHPVLENFVTWMHIFFELVYYSLLSIGLWKYKKAI